MATVPAQAPAAAPEPASAPALASASSLPTALTIGWLLAELERWVEDGGSARTVLLSHHQLGRAMAEKTVGAGIRDKTAKVRETRRIHAWFWGHEHRAFMYEPYTSVDCPVCLGNGGVPELLSHQLTLAGAFATVSGWVTDLLSLFRQRVPAPKILWQPTNPDVDKDGLKWAKLGYVVLDIDGPSGTGVYYDETGAPVGISAFGR